MRLLLIGYWLLFWGLAGSAVAQWRGQGKLESIILAATLGPVGVMGILASRPNWDLMDKRLLAAGFRRCPSCAEMINPEAVVCRFCGRDMPTLAGQ